MSDRTWNVLGWLFILGIVALVVSMGYVIFTGVALDQRFAGACEWEHGHVVGDVGDESLTCLRDGQVLFDQAAFEDGNRERG